MIANIRKDDKVSESLFAISLSLFIVVVFNLQLTKLKSKMLILEKIAVITLIPTILVTVLGVCSSLNEKDLKIIIIYGL